MSFLDHVREENKRARKLIEKGGYDGFTVLILPGGQEQILLTPKGSTKRALASILKDMT